MSFYGEESSFCIPCNLEAAHSWEVALGDIEFDFEYRKVTTESSTGSTTSNRIRTILTVQVISGHDLNVFFQ